MAPDIAVCVGGVWQPGKDNATSNLGVNVLTCSELWICRFHMCSWTIIHWDL